LSKGDAVKRFSESKKYALRQPLKPGLVLAFMAPFGVVSQSRPCFGFYGPFWSRLSIKPFIGQFGFLINLGLVWPRNTFRELGISFANDLLNTGKEEFLHCL
jgi:hypothetical protein